MPIRSGHTAKEDDGLGVFYLLQIGKEATVLEGLQSEEAFSCLVIWVLVIRKVIGHFFAGFYSVNEMLFFEEIEPI